MKNKGLSAYILLALVGAFVALSLLPEPAPVQADFTCISSDVCSGGGVSATATPAPTASPAPTATVIPGTVYVPAVDATAIAKGSSDDTKLLRFEVDGFTAGQTRVLTPKDASYTIAGTNTTQTFTSQQTFNSVIFAQDAYHTFGADGNDNIIMKTSSFTPYAGLFGTGAGGNAWHMAEKADYSYDYNNGPCGTSACTNPQFIIHDKDQNTTDYAALSISGLTGKFSVTLTETTATSVVQIPVAAESGVSGQFIYTVYATDGSTPQVRSGRVLYSVTNDGGTETCVLGTPEELDNTPTGTLTATIACSTSPTNAVNITIDATSSLSQTTLEAYGHVIHVGAGEPIPQ